MQNTLCETSLKGCEWNIARCSGSGLLYYRSQQAIQIMSSRIAPGIEKEMNTTKLGQQVMDCKLENGCNIHMKKTLTFLSLANCKLIQQQK